MEVGQGPNGAVAPKKKNSKTDGMDVKFIILLNIKYSLIHTKTLFPLIRRVLYG
jgi:hypothetical protein